MYMKVQCFRERTPIWKIWLILSNWYNELLCMLKWALWCQSYHSELWPIGFWLLKISEKLNLNRCNTLVKNIHCEVNSLFKSCVSKAICLEKDKYLKIFCFIIFEIKYNIDNIIYIHTYVLYQLNANILYFKLLAFFVKFFNKIFNLFFLFIYRITI